MWAALLFKLPRFIAMPLALLVIALAGLAIAVIAISLPLIMVGLWLRRTVAEWRTKRVLVKLLAMQASSSKPHEGATSQ
jgi:hypothetical protein